jgi:hypothetical protein
MDAIHLLLVLTRDETGQLRQLIQDLKDGGKRAGRLLSAVRRFAVKFVVHITANSEVHFSDRMAAAIFQPVTKGLSNIRWHTRAIRATKYNHRSDAACAPMMDKTRSVHWLSRSKNACAAFTRASRDAKSSPWVASRRHCRHSLSIGKSTGLWTLRLAAQDCHE